MGPAAETIGPAVVVVMVSGSETRPPEAGRLMTADPEADDPILFEAVIVPHRSLSPRGLRVLVGAIGGLSTLMALRFLLVHAWPVIGFSVVETGLAVVLLRLNARRAKQSELLLLSESGLRIVRTDPYGHRQERLLPHTWLNVVLEDIPGRVPRLMLGRRGVLEEIASSLGETEKRDLAFALREALYRLHNPQFENPQLHE